MNELSDLEVSVSQALQVGNFTQLILEQSQKHPSQTAIHHFDDSSEANNSEDNSSNSITYSELASRVAHFQTELAERGFTAGDRLLILCLPKGNCFPLIIAMLASKIVPVFIDPRIGYPAILRALNAASLTALICDANLAKWRWLFKPLWRLPFINLDAIGRMDSKKESKKEGKQEQPDNLDSNSQTFTVQTCDEQDPAIVTYTSGTTGQSKGAVRTHAKLLKQFSILSKLSPPQPNETGLTFLHFAALHGLCLGVSTVLPDIELRKGAIFSPDKIVKQINQHQVTCLGGAPYYINALMNYLQQHPQQYPQQYPQTNHQQNHRQQHQQNTLPANALRLIVLGSAGTHPNLIHNIQRLQPECKIQICYGATEAEPISVTDGQELLTAYQKTELPRWQQGYFVGQPVAEIELRIVDLQTGLHSYPDQVGEIWISGPHILEGYTDPELTRQRQHLDTTGRVWHRTGDRARLDKNGALWLVGRNGDEITLTLSAERMEHNIPTVIDPFPIEIIMDTINGVNRSALVQRTVKNKQHKTTEDQGPMLFLELPENLYDQKRQSIFNEVERQLQSLYLSDIPYTVIPHIPVDTRHQSKIDRQPLKTMALQKLVKHASKRRTKR